LQGVASKICKKSETETKKTLREVGCGCVVVVFLGLAGTEQEETGKQPEPPTGLLPFRRRSD